MRNHKHEGVTKSHPIKQQHNNVNAQKAHNYELRLSERKTYWQGTHPVIKEKIGQPKPVIKETIGQPKETLQEADTGKFAQVVEKNDSEYVLVPIDKDGFINIDLDSTKQDGIRVLFKREEGRKRRTVALQIDKR